MKERPILFNGEMVRAILAGRKTRTRRVMKPQPPAGNYRYDGVAEIDGQEVEVGHHFLERLDDDGGYTERYWDAGECPFGVPGDRLWVRETFCHCDDVEGFDDKFSMTCYKATKTGLCRDCDETKWRPSIHMPRHASRITLEVTGVRVESLWDISAEDAKAEGMKEPMIASESGYETEMRGQFFDLWDSIAKPGVKWSDNPWVWVIEFRRVENV